MGSHSGAPRCIIGTRQKLYAGAACGRCDQGGETKRREKQMNAFSTVALIIGIFFIVGIAIGFLAVMAVPALYSVLRFRDTPSRRAALTVMEILRNPSETSV